MGKSFQHEFLVFMWDLMDDTFEEGARGKQRHDLSPRT